MIPLQHKQVKINNSSLKWTWLVVDIYQTTKKHDGKYPLRFFHNTKDQRANMKEEPYF